MIINSHEGKIGEGTSCSVEIGHAMIETGLHPVTGGTGMQACAGDLKALLKMCPLIIDL